MTPIEIQDALLDWSNSSILVKFPKLNDENAMYVQSIIKIVIHQIIMIFKYCCDIL
jgi:hypothetical protein